MVEQEKEWNPIVCVGCQSELKSDQQRYNAYNTNLHLFCGESKFLDFPEDYSGDKSKPASTEPSQMQKPMMIADHIIDKVFLGGRSSTLNLGYLQTLTVTRMIIIFEDTNALFPKEIDYLFLKAEDNAE